jgi:uncharacterized protein YndB with AHSA1/START domain
MRNPGPASTVLPLGTGPKFLEVAVMIEDGPVELILEPDRSSRHSLGLKASPAEVYRALTDTEELQRWFVEEASIDLQEGGEFRWVFGRPGGDPDAAPFITTGRCIAIVKQELLRLKAIIEDLETEVEFRIDPWRDGAILTVTHAGFPGDEAWDATFSAIDRGWQTELHVLKLFLERGRGLMRVAERHERRIEGSAEDLFDSFTTPAGLAGWLADRAAVDPTPGGEIRLEWDGHGVSGHYAVCDPDRFLLMTWEEEPPSLVRVWIEEEDGLVELKVDHIRFAADTGARRSFDWEAALDRLRASARVGRAGE